MTGLTARCILCNELGMEKLHQYLQKNGLSQREFARKIGIHPSAMSRLLSNLTKPDVDLVFAIERATKGAVPAKSWVSSEAAR